MIGTSTVNDKVLDVAVVGGGLAGLTAAVTLAKGGLRVGIFEQSKHVGGRASTQVQQGIHFNLGAHALYARGSAAARLKELGVSFHGHHPSAATGQVTLHGKLHPLPGGLVSLVSSRFLALREKWRLARLLAGLQHLDPTPIQATTVTDWLDRVAGTGNLALLLRGLIRLTTYCDDPEHQSAGSALEQLKLAFGGNVWYLDGGWQTLIDGLRNLAVQLGVAIETGKRVAKVMRNGSAITLEFRDGRSIVVPATVLATAPEVAVELLGLEPASPLATWLERRRSVRAACLDVALSKTPVPEARFALGLDRPFYYSMHSATAQLAPGGVTVIHLMKYLKSEDQVPTTVTRAELENLLDVMQPGWRPHVVRQRFLPNLSVAGAVPRADEGGLAGRPDVAGSGDEAVFLAGDWVGKEGQLADAAVASGTTAARRILDNVKRSGASAHERTGSSHARERHVQISR